MQLLSQLQIQNLNFSRNNCVIFEDLNFTLQSGELLQVLGNNGSGKTSLLRILAGIMLAQGGEVLWKGEPIQTIKSEYYQQLFYLGHKQGVKEELTVLENLYFDLKKGECVDFSVKNILKTLRLAHCATKLCSQLSQGQRQRVALARMLLSNAKLWILDEPFSFLDASGAKEIQHYFLQQLKNGGMIILSSHRAFSFTCIPLKSLQLRSFEDD